MPSLNDFLDWTTASTHEKATRSTVIGIKPRRGAFRRVTMHVRSSESYSDPNGHFVTVLWPTIPELRSADFDSRIGSQTPTTARARVYCSCPAFKYWGSAYHTTDGGYGIPGKPREYRPPFERDPQGTRIVCKHLISVTNAIQPYSFTYLSQLFNVQGPIRTRRSNLGDIQFLDIGDAIPIIRSTIQAATGMNDVEFRAFAAILDEDNWEDEFEKIGVINQEDMTADG